MIDTNQILLYRKKFAELDKRVNNRSLQYTIKAQQRKIKKLKIERTMHNEYLR